MSTSFSDTICAISTPAGVGGIAVIRVSGPGAPEIVNRIWKGKPVTDMLSHTAHLGEILDNGALLDQAVVTIFRAPKSFTGEDVMEIAVHGSKYVQRRLLQLLVDNGCRLAEAGEFTRRAFANGKMDLAQAEAVADVIASNSKAAHQLAAQQMKGTYSARLNQLHDKLLELASLLELELDFSEEDVEFASRKQLRSIACEVHDEVTRLYTSFSAGAAIKEGIPVAIVGPTNAGKSSLLNLLLGEDRAIVSDIHGTTRDTIDGLLNIGDYQFRIIDTAGLRDTSDPIEAIGIDRSRRALDHAAIAILILDASQPLPATLPVSISDDTPLILLLNKTDLLDESKAESRQTTLSATLNSLPTEIPSILNSVATSISERLDALSTKFADLLKHCHPRLIDPRIIPFSVKTNLGLNTLQTTLVDIADTLRGNADEDTIIVTNLRHAENLKAASAATQAILDGLDANLPGDLIAQDLRATIHHLSAITGTITTPAILSTIFSRFCIGK